MKLLVGWLAMVSVSGFALEVKLQEAGAHAEGYCLKQIIKIEKGNKVDSTKLNRAEDEDFARNAEYRAKEIYKKFFGLQSKQLNVVSSKVSFGKDEGDKLKKLQGIKVELEEEGSDEMYLVVYFTPKWQGSGAALLAGIHEHQGSDAYFVCESPWQ